MTINRWSTVVAGFGSPHGDDQAGWRVAAMLQTRPELPARVVAVYEATQLIETLTGCERLIVVDACRSGNVVGSVTRFRWPDLRIAKQHGQSTHGVSVFQALELAERLQQLPPTVEIFGIEIECCSPGGEVTQAVLHAVRRVEAEICSELLEVAHA